MICSTNKYYHDWTYYLLGPAGEQLAVYNGVQVSYSDTLNHSGRRVYMYAHSFVSAGGSLVTLSDTTKQFNIFDNLGSCRSVISVKGINLEIQSIDYKPFGDTLNSTTESRIGYIGKERDKENSYFAMGMRQYDCTTGRFLSIDPYFEKFREQTPYQYAFNNPITFKDPTGLEPESEKGGEDRMLWTVIQQDMSTYDQIASNLVSFGEDMQRRIAGMVQMMNEIFAEIAAKQAYLDYKWGVLSRAFGGGGGGASSGGGGRTGDAGENGIPLTDEMKEEIKKNIKVTKDCKENKEIADKFYQKLFEAIGESIRESDYKFYSTANLEVDIVNDEDFENYARGIKRPDAVGFHFGFSDGSFIMYKEGIFEEGFIFGPYNTERTNLNRDGKEYYDLSQTILHEFGHAYQNYLFPSNGYPSSRSFFDKENDAILFVNSRYNINNNRPLQKLY